MEKRTMWFLLAGVVLLLIIAAVCVLLVLRKDGLLGSGVYFVSGGVKA